MANGPGTALTNSSTETSIFAGFASTTGSLVIPAGLLVPGKILRVVWLASANFSGTGILTLNTYLGSTKVLSGANVAAPAVNTGASIFNHQSSIFVQSVGASGKVLGEAICSGATSVLAGLFSLYQTSGGATPAQVTVDTTVALTIDLKAKWNEVNAADSVQILGAAVFIDG
jgi:hypothetical protein